MSIASKRRVAHLKAGLKKIPGLTGAARLLKFLASPQHRSIMRLQRDKPEGLFQPYGETSFDRYPHIFAFVQERLSAVAAPHNIAVCRRKRARSRDASIRFELAEILGVEPEAHYDAVFCMAVLRHGELGTTRA